ncbi:hypothetical protein ACFLVH_06220 [Chloroflexota bacterium]
MLRWRNKKPCGYWNCNKTVKGGEFLCPGHYESWVNGLIDRCPKCGRFKDIAYQLCLDCYISRPVKPWEPSVIIPASKQPHKVEYSDAWVDGYMRPDRVLIYILELDDGVLYVGHTADLRKGLSEHREQKVAATAGRHPKLRYAEAVAGKHVAELRQDELEKLIESNPGQIRLMIGDFQNDMRKLGFEESS